MPWPIPLVLCWGGGRGEAKAQKSWPPPHAARRRRETMQCAGWLYIPVPIIARWQRMLGCGCGEGPLGNWRHDVRLWWGSGCPSPNIRNPIKHTTPHPTHHLTSSPAHPFHRDPRPRPAQGYSPRCTDACLRVPQAASPVCRRKEGKRKEREGPHHPHTRPATPSRTTPRVRTTPKQAPPWPA